MIWDSPKGNLKEATSSDVRFLLAETDRQEQGKDVEERKSKNLARESELQGSAGLGSEEPRCLCP